MKIVYCKKCVMPDTKPDLLLNDESVCNACRSYENRVQIDWNARKNELESILNKYKSKDGSNWDCIIPVSPRQYSNKVLSATDFRIIYKLVDTFNTDAMLWILPV